MKDCFPTYQGKCVSYEGKQYLDYLRGDSVEQVIEKLSAYVTEKVNSNNGGGAIYLDGTVSTCSGKLVDTGFTYSISPKSSAVEMSYNFSETTSNLPAGFNVITSGMEVITNTGNIVNLRGPINGASFAPFDFPLSIKFYVNVNTQCGLIALVKNVKEYANPNEVVSNFTAQDFGSDSTTKFNTAAEAITYLNDKIASLDKKIENRTKIRDGTTVTDYIYSISNELNNAINLSSSVKEEFENSSVVSKVATNTSDIESLIKSVEQLKSENTSLRLQVEQLKNQVNK